MQADRKKLILMALAALEELVDQAKDAPIQPSIAIRVVLAATFAHSDGRREPYDDFWKAMQISDDDQPTKSMAQYVRTS